MHFHQFKNNNSLIYDSLKPRTCCMYIWTHVNAFAHTENYLQISFGNIVALQICWSVCISDLFIFLSIRFIVDQNYFIQFFVNDKSIWKHKNCIHLQEKTLGLFRSDYMVHSHDANEVKQVEFNTIASSFGGISSELQSLHRYSY